MEGGWRMEDIVHNVSIVKHSQLFDRPSVAILLDDRVLHSKHKLEVPSNLR